MTSKIIKIDGIVIKETPYKENSKILNILCDKGVIGVISKGCKQIKSPLRVISNKLTYAEFVIYYHEDGLSTLKEGSIINNLNNIKSNLDTISYFIYITDLTSQVINEGNTSTIYDLYINTVLKMEDNYNPLIMTNILEVKYLDYLGAPINFNSCVKCGSGDDIVTISSVEGGYICKNCHTNEIIYNPKMIKMLKMYYLVDIKTIKDLKISDNIVESINEFLIDYYDSYTGIYLKSRNFINNR